MLDRQVLRCCSHSNDRFEVHATDWLWPKAAAQVISSRSRYVPLDFSLLRNFQCIVYLNAEVANGALQLGVAK